MGKAILVGAELASQNARTPIRSPNMPQITTNNRIAGEQGGEEISAALLPRALPLSAELAPMLTISMC